jgi:hypothetical protein
MPRHVLRLMMITRRFRSSDRRRPRPAALHGRCRTLTIDLAPGEVEAGEIAIVCNARGPCFVCGRPAECKDFLWARACGQALSCVRSRSAAVHPPRPRMGSTQIGSKSAWRARGAPKHSGFSDPVLLTVCPYRLIDLLTVPTPSIATGASRVNRFRSSIALSRHHQSPGDPRRAVRQRYSDNQARLSLHHPFEPCPLWRPFTRRPAHTCHRAKRAAAEDRADPFSRFLPSGFCRRKSFASV